MAQLNPKEMQQALAKPFAPEDLEWRLQNTICAAWPFPM